MYAQQHQLWQLVVKGQLVDDVPLLLLPCVPAAA